MVVRTGWARAEAVAVLVAGTSTATNAATPSPRLLRESYEIDHTTVQVDHAAPAFAPTGDVVHPRRKGTHDDRSTHSPRPVGRRARRFHGRAAAADARRPSNATTLFRASTAVMVYVHLLHHPARTVRRADGASLAEPKTPPAAAKAPAAPGCRRAPGTVHAGWTVVWLAPLAGSARRPPVSSASQRAGPGCSALLGRRSRSPTSMATTPQIPSRAAAARVVEPMGSAMNHWTSPSQAPMRIRTSPR